MAIDYAAIKRDNITKYGTDIDQYGDVLLQNLYSDQTHFIFELLQNAEDAGAIRVHFRLYADRLEFEHDGRPFNEEDVRGICGLVVGTKRNDITKIGKFGIGFKSVYAHTSSPEIHSAEEHFAIDNYVHPRSIEALTFAARTLFVFPFNRENKSADESYQAIAERLKDLSAQTLLFLSNIDSISFQIEDDRSGTYERQVDNCFESDFAKIVFTYEKGFAGESRESWLVFSRNVAHLLDADDLSDDKAQVSTDTALAVQLAFKLKDFSPHTAPAFDIVRQSLLSVFFPTERDTHLGFLMQGPYQTNSARDDIRRDVPFNKALAKETGELVVEALRWLRDRDWLTVNVLETMPLAHTTFEYGVEQEVNLHQGTLFECVYEQVKRALMDEAFIPAFGDGYVAGGNARIARSAALRTLLDTSKLDELLDTDNQPRWLADDITFARTRDLWRYLTTILGIEEVNAAKFVEELDHDFLVRQSDEWIRNLYEYASSFRSHSYPLTSPFNVLKQKPIVRLKDGKHVVPYDGLWSGKPQAYLPKEHESPYPTVKREVCNSDKAVDFLKKLGLKEPDDVDEVLEKVLPKYDDKPEIGVAEHKEHIALIVRALGVDSRESRQKLLSKLRATPFLLAENGLGVTAYRNPGEIYFRTSSLMKYFCGNPDAWFLKECYDDLADVLSQLGIQNTIRLSYRRPDWNGYVRLREPWGERGSRYDPYVGGQNEFDPDFGVDGLEYALLHPSIDRAVFVWNRILSEYRSHISGRVVKSTRRDFSKILSSEATVSKMGKLLRDTAWLPDGNGNFVKPSELALDDLPSEFRKDNDLANALGMRVSNFNIEDAPDDIRAKLLALQGRSPEETEEAFALLDEKKRIERERVETLEPGEYPNELSDTSEQTGHPGVLRPYLPESAEPDVSAEDKRIETELEMGDEPTADERYEVKPRRVWRPKNPETRKFLESKYRGCCQICGYTFQQRNGTNYFEAIHLIPRTEGKYLDHPRNALCLCAHHSAQFQHAERQFAASSLVDQIKSYEGIGNHTINVELCGEWQRITFHADHMIELKTALEVAELL